MDNLLKAAGPLLHQAQTQSLFKTSGFPALEPSPTPTSAPRTMRCLVGWLRIGGQWTPRISVHAPGPTSGNGEARFLALEGILAEQCPQGFSVGATLPAFSLHPPEGGTVGVLDLSYFRGNGGWTQSHTLSPSTSARSLSPPAAFSTDSGHRHLCGGGLRPPGLHSAEVITWWEEASATKTRGSRTLASLLGCPRSELRTRAPREPRIPGRIPHHLSPARVTKPFSLHSPSVGLRLAHPL